MAMCDLQPAHRSLTLRAAMSLSYKHKNYITGICDIKIRFLDF
jgi:coatomer protein complex subunit alpha (xenin)